MRFYMKMSKKKVGLFSMHAAPYKDPVFERMMKNSDYDIEVITLFKQAVTHREWNNNYILPYHNTFLRKALKIPKFGEIHLDMFKLLKEKKFDGVMVTGYYPLSSLFLLMYSLISRTPFIYTADSTVLPLNNIPVTQNLKGKVLSFILTRARAIWLPGVASKEFHKQYFKIDSRKIFEGSYALDTVQLHNRIEMEYINKAKIRNGLGIDEDSFLFLFVGKLIPSRNISNLLFAFKEALDCNQNLSLLIIGDGPETSKVEEFIRSNPELAIKHIHGVTFEDLDAYYSCSDAYVHPGIEPYSLALVEAVIAGLPVITTNQVGAAYDYVKDNINGYVINDQDVMELTQAMMKTARGTLSKNDTKAMQDFITKERNVTWASNQLIEALNRLFSTELS